MFRDRFDAGTQLADRLKRFKNQDVVIWAIPKGGLPLGALVASRLNAPLDVALSKKIGHPYNREYAIGAVGLKDSLLTDAVGVTKGYIKEETERIRKKLTRRYNQYYRNRSPQNLLEKTVIIIDDGIATGNTILVTVALAHRQNPKKIVVAIPVAPDSAIQTLRDSKLIDEVICLHTSNDFQAVGQYYEDFPQVSEQEALLLMEGMGNKALE